MAKRKKPTENQKLYRKERRRVQQFIRRAEKRGYIFPEDIIPEIPKRVSKKAIESLKAKTPEELYKSARFLDVETGELISGTERRKEERRLAYAKGRKTKEIKKVQPEVPHYPTIDIFESIRSSIEDLERKVYPMFPIEGRKGTLLRIFDDTVTFYSDNEMELHEYFERHEYEIAELLNIIMYDSNAEIVELTFSKLGELLNRKDLSREQAEELSLYSEYEGDYYIE